ncbi:DNA-directed RNA polymerase [Musa troglodytarum]|uniref:DNA-directed RNA polymerase n=1 Tax=Musa troglodytarum TaxID=320322 RepID=A0A9E7H1L2_9LILI|nr:DNA-directed RNA polymerase [Musa troglodytarum]
MYYSTGTPHQEYYPQPAIGVSRRGPQGPGCGSRRATRRVVRDQRLLNGTLFLPNPDARFLVPSPFFAAFASPFTYSPLLSARLSCRSQAAASVGNALFLQRTDQRFCVVISLLSFVFLSLLLGRIKIIHMDVDLIMEQAIPSGRLSGIIFDLMTDADIEKICNVSIVEANEVTSAKLGLPNASSQCATCGSRNIRDCDGHSGFIKLPKTIYHPFFVTEVVHILNQICPGCKTVKKDLKLKGCVILEASEKAIGEGIYTLEAFGKNLTVLQRRLLKLCRSKLMLPTRSILARNTKVRFINLKKILKTRKLSPPFPHLLDFFFLVCHTFFLLLHLPSSLSLSPGLDGIDLYQVLAADWYQHWTRNWVSKDSQVSCKYCARKANGWYPPVKFKISSKDILGRRSLSIIAEVNEKLPKKFHSKSLSEVLPEDYWNFIPKVSMQQGAKPSKIDLTPHQVFCLLRELDPEFIQQFVSRRELLFLSYLPITPNCQRVVETSHVFADGPKLSFDERTRAYKRLADTSKKIGEFRHHQQFGPLATSYTMSRVLDCFNASKASYTIFFSHACGTAVVLFDHQSNLHAASSSRGDSTSGLRWLKDVVLSKRTDNVFRMTMVGDPKIKLQEIGIPFDISESLIVAEQVNSYNFEKLNMSCNLHLLRKEGLNTRSNRQLTSLHKTNQLQVGDVVYRPLENGDIILVNRPPSVHQHSLIALSVMILPIQSVISINPLCCAPLLGDFDGDCLHGYVPQSIGCRVELQELLSLDNQLFNAQDGRSLVSLTHDSLTAAYLLTANREFLNKVDMQQLAMLCPFPMLPPAVVKTSKFQIPLWTGEQLFSMLLPPTMDFGVNSRNMICKGEVMASLGGSFWLQNTTTGLFTTMFKHYGRKALDYLCCSQELLCEYLSLRGLSVSLGDVYLSSDSYSRRKMMDEIYFGLEEAEDACQVMQLMLEPEMENLLRNHNKDEDTLDCMSQYKIAQERTCVSQVSIAAFKNVYHDLLSQTYQFISKDNSMLEMIEAGSKGSLVKLIQQGACLGLQLFAHPLPFTVPSKLNCCMWNNLKALDGVISDAAKCLCGQNSYAVISASFLDGLNPLECFVHAICGRANLFTENAELPGTLTRKLMFYMRDLYLAYDGTVRSAYGQQIVEFSYSILEDSTEGGEACVSYDGKGAEYTGLGGEPVGSWAACSISEAAYGSLEFPINSLEDSPLMKLKMVLECCKSNASTNHTALLFLSKRLHGWRYGFEYGALEVKNHLERVCFFNLIVTVMILYGGHDVQGTNFSPWIMHFHVSKDKMLRRRLNVQFVKNELIKHYNCTREKMNPMLPRLCFVSKSVTAFFAALSSIFLNCSSAYKWKEHDDSFCLSVAAETSESLIQLDTIRDMVIPLLLETPIKGFWASEKVEILCESLPSSGSELFLKVTMSKKCLPGSFWSNLQSACIPIMDLIDWQRSHPDNVYNISGTYGIDAAWKYFVKSLKSVTADIGRDIHKRHLFMAADCLSVTGEFHGLSTKGLRQQRNDMSISSPFAQACLSNPVNCFVNAAKQGSMDHLSGTLDAVAWGKEAPIGTGGPFEIVYSGKVHNLIRGEGIYKNLHSIKAELQQGDSEVRIAANQTVPAKWKQQPKYSTNFDGAKETIDPQTSDEDHLNEGIVSKFPTNNCKGHNKRQQKSANNFLAKSHLTFGLRSKFSSESVSSWTDVVDMCSSLRTILYKYPIDGFLDEKDKSSLIEALNYHPKRAAKVGSGIQKIKVGHSPLHPGSRCFVLLRSDGSLEDFSYRKCVVGAAKLISPEFGSIVHKKIFHSQ